MARSARPVVVVERAPASVEDRLAQAQRVLALFAVFSSAMANDPGDDGATEIDRRAASFLSDLAAEAYDGLDTAIRSLPGEVGNLSAESEVACIRTDTERLMIHTGLTGDDRDAVDTLRHRIEQHALVVQHTLETWDEVDGMGDRDRQTLQAAMAEFCASIVADTRALREVLTVAANRTGGE